MEASEYINAQIDLTDMEIDLIEEKKAYSLDKRIRIPDKECKLNASRLTNKYNKAQHYMECCRII